jgi:hypothetical protein
VWGIEDSRAAAISSRFLPDFGAIAPIYFALMDLQPPCFFPPLGPALAKVFVYKRRPGNAAPKEKPMSQLYSNLKQPASNWQMALVVTVATVTMGFLLRPLM